MSESSKHVNLTEGLRLPSLVVVEKQNKDIQSECIKQGLAMLVIPEKATREEKQAVLGKYKNFKLVIIEHATMTLLKNLPEK